MGQRDLQAREGWRDLLDWWWGACCVTTLCDSSIVCDAGLAIKSGSALSELSCFRQLGDSDNGIHTVECFLISE